MLKMDSALRHFLGMKLASKDMDFNVVSLRGGKYKVREHQYLMFLKTLYKKMSEQTFETSMSLGWRTDGRKYLPVTFDFDCIRATPDEITNDKFQLLASNITRYLVDASKQTENGFGVFLTRKPVYEKQYKDQTHYKTGCHMYIIGLEVTRQWINFHYVELCKIIERFSEQNQIVNPVTDILDKSVSPIGKNGLLFAGEYKRDNNGRYYIFFRALFADGVFMDVVNYTELQRFETFEENYDMMYSFLTNYVNFQTTQIVKIDLDDDNENTNEPGNTHTTTRLNANMKFDFETFLKLTKKHCADQKEYCRIVCFLAQVGFPGDLADDLCNQYWNTGGKYDKYETSKFIARYDSARYPPVKIAHIKDYFDWYKTDKEYEVEKLFTQKIIVFYNEYKVFMTGEHCLSDVYKFINQMCEYVFSCKIFTWLDYTDEMGVKNIRRVISKTPPFKGTDDFYVAIYASRKKIAKSLRDEEHNLISEKRKINEERIKLIQQCLQKEDEFIFRTTAKQILGDKFPESKQTLMSSVVHECHLIGEINRYTNIVFKPYSIELPAIPHNVINTFPGFSWMDYTPKKIYKPEDSMLMTFLFEVYNFSNPDMLQLNYLLNFFAWKIQFPFLRSEKIWCVVSKIHGVGKSSLFSIFEFLFGKSLCLFHCTLDSLCCRFNAANSSKLIHHIDDLHGCSNKKDTRKLFPLATTHRIIYEAKGEKRVQLDEYAEIFITSNSESPLYIGVQDRRQVILQVDPCWKGNKLKFDQLYKEFDDPDWAHAWFHYLLHRNLGNFDPKNQQPPLNLTIEAKLKCMPTTHRFVKDFFAVADFHKRLYNDAHLTQYSIERCEDETIGNVHIRCGIKSLYEQYKKFAQTFYNGGVVKLNTFVEQVCDVGLTRVDKPKRINGTNPMVVFDIGFKTVFDRFSELYHTEIDQWYCESDTDDFMETI